jgi:hypothetical protein
MTPPLGSEPQAGEPAKRPRIDAADLALILAFQAWPALGPLRPSVPNEPIEAGRGGAQRWNRLERSWRERLRTPSDTVPAAGCDRTEALERLRRMHETSMRVDLNRVHPSWCVRALKEESPAVRRAVAAYFPEPMRSAILTGLSLDAHDLAGDRPASSEVLNWSLVLWTERLVGGDPGRTDDPPAIAVLTRLAPRRGYAICSLAGELKCLLGGAQPSRKRPSAVRAVHMRSIQESMTGADPRFLDQVSRDLQSKALIQVPLRHRAARLGLLTLARLLADCEPFRLRWALQHWPYPISKLIRLLIPSAKDRSEPISEGETLILKTAWDRLKLEGKVACAWPD